MIILRSLPGILVMTAGTVGRETQRLVIGKISCAVVLGMTGKTGSRRPGKTAVMTAGTVSPLVCTIQRKRCGMIKANIFCPVDRRRLMAAFTVKRKIGQVVVRVNRRDVVAHVAGKTGDGCSAELV